MKQCAILVPKETFKSNELFWVTNTEIDQSNRGLVTVARSWQSLGCGYDFTPQQITELFTVRVS